MIPIQHRLHIGRSPVDLAIHEAVCDLRVHMPAIVQSFDPDRLVVSVLPAVKEVMLQNGVRVQVPIVELFDIPVSLPHAGGWAITLPIAQGDECVLEFQDMGIDIWWQNGGVQKQPDGVLFRHAIGDAIATFGPFSQPNVLSDYSTSSMQLRSLDGSVKIDLSSDGVAIFGPSVSGSSVGGTTQFLVAEAFFTWFTTQVIPFLDSKGFTGTPPPANSITTVIQGE